MEYRVDFAIVPVTVYRILRKEFYDDGVNSSGKTRAIGDFACEEEAERIRSLLATGAPAPDQFITISDSEATV